MNLSTSLGSPVERSILPKIKVIGVGGAGGNAVNCMINDQSYEGIDFLVANTDIQQLESSLCPEELRIQLGPNITKGLGAGSIPDVGSSAAEESINEIIEHLRDTNMVFVTAGMGGGTGTGAAPLIAKAARELGILTIGVATKPFHFEGTNRMKAADSGIIEMSKNVDTLVVIPNQNLFNVTNESTTLQEAFDFANNVLKSGVGGISSLITFPGMINLDFADIRRVMSSMGRAMIGSGESTGDNRAIVAMEAAIFNPLLDRSSIKGAKDILINITGGDDIKLSEVDMAVNRLREEVSDDVNIIFGSSVDNNINGKIKIMVIATGIDAATSADAKDSSSGLISDSFYEDDKSMPAFLRRTKQNV